MPNPHDQQQLQAALSYARWLHQKQFNDWMNQKRAEVGWSPEPSTICLNSVGEAVYKQIRTEILAQRSEHAGVLLAEGERRAVVSEILSRMKGGR